MATKAPLIGRRRRCFLRRSRKPRQAVAVHFLVAVLSGVTAGGVQQDGFVGEPPVAVAGAAYPAHLAGPQRKTQAGVDQRGGFAGAGRADDDVPGQLIEVLAAPGLAAEPGLLEGGQRFVQPFSQRGDFFGRCGFLLFFTLLLLSLLFADRPPDRRRRAAATAATAGLARQIGQHVAVAAQGIDVIDELRQPISAAHGHDGKDPAQIRGQRTLAGDRYQRPDVPDQDGDRQQPNDADEPAILKNSGNPVHDSP
jgi:hypothetical protein